MITKLAISRRWLFVALLALGLTIPTLNLVGKGKPGGGTPPPPPPVTYEVRTFTMPADPAYLGNINTYKMTSSGVVVGYYTTTDNRRHPFMYDPSQNADVAIDLNDLGVNGLPPNCRIAVALDINEHGFLVGAIEEITNPGFYQGFVLDLNQAPPKLNLLPDGPEHTYARGINDNMDILGVSSDPLTGAWRAYLYNPLFDTSINDLGLSVLLGVELSNPPAGEPAQVTGQSPGGIVFRYKQGSGLDPAVQFAGTVNGISPLGEICGGYPIPNTQHGYMAYRFGNALETFSDLRTAFAINGHGDFVYQTVTGGKDFNLYHEGTGIIVLNDTLVGSSEDLAFWNNGYFRFFNDMTERGAINPEVADFPGLCGSLTVLQTSKSGKVLSSEERGFVLIPVTPPTL